MTYKHAFKALDKTLRDMKTKNSSYGYVFFGNKVILFGGDFRQILPVVRKGNRTQIVNASIKRSEFWKKTQILKLKINMRVFSANSKHNLKAKEFSDFL